MTDKPIRIQRRREKGWKMPENTVIVTRPTIWGNPFIITQRVAPGKHTGGCYIAVPTVEDAVECYRIMVTEHRPDIVQAAQKELRGKNLACWCPLDAPCHADVLLKIANAPRALAERLHGWQTDKEANI
jgi:hypothetical protein